VKAKRIAVIGAGNMGGALVAGILRADWGSPANVTVTNPGKRRLEELKKAHGVKTTTSNRKAAEGADIVLLAVKPQILDLVLDEIRDVARPDQLFVSIAAGVTTAHIEERLGGDFPVVRSMPNVCVTVRDGATAICPGANATREHLDLARALFEAVGLVVDVPEHLMDAVTGLSGTGPMYVFQILEGLSDAGVKVGLSRSVSSALAVQTMVGAARMAQASDRHPAALKDLVTSPGGTAITALHSLERNRLRAILMDAVEAATERSKALGAMQVAAQPKRLEERERVP
jgi:pyrroline-5-carboxylate reductase